MSAEYKVIGERKLRKYTAKRSTPVYSAESDVAYVASHLCDVPWSDAGGVRDATVTWHTNEVVHKEGEEPNQKTWTGLDWNVVIRNEFDAALFCAGHEGGGHRVYANAAVYVYKLPNDAVGKTLQSLTGKITSDPYNAKGARVSVLTNSTGVIPTDCAVCRNGGIWSGSAYTASDSFHTPTDANGCGVAPRTARSESGGSESWFPTTASFTLNPSSFVLQQYLMVFVVLENYNVCRGNWIEGSSFLENRVSITLNSAVSSWDTLVAAGKELYLGESAGQSYDVIAANGFTSVVGSGRKYAVAECPRCGVEEPERAVYSGYDFTSNNAGIWSEATPTTIDRAFAGRIVGCSQMSISYVDVTNPTVSTTSYSAKLWNGGIVAAYDPSNDGSGDLPGLSFYQMVYPAFGSSDHYDVVQLVLNGRVSGSVPVSARQMLVSGEVTRIFVVPAFSWFNASSVPENRSILDRQAYLIVIANDAKYEIVGYLVNTGYRTKTALSAGWDVYHLANGDTFGDHNLVCCAFMRSRFESFAATYTPAYCTTNVTFDDSNRTITFLTPETQLPSKTLFYAWKKEMSSTQVMVMSNKAGTLGCYGSFISVEPCGNYGTVMGQTAFSSVVVSGNLERVGSTECRNVAYVDMYPSDDGTLTEGIVSVPDYDGDISPVSYDSSYRVIPVPRTTSNGIRLGVDVDAIVTSKTGIQVGSSIVNAAFVRGTPYTVTSASSPLNANLMNAFNSVAFHVLVVGYSMYSAAMYGSTSIDTLLQTSDSASAAIGLRNCYGNLADGVLKLVDAPASVNPCVIFTLTPAVKQKRITNDFGYTSSVLSFPMWRICSSYVIVPFVFPDVATTSVRKVRLSWTAVAACTQGTVFNVWIRVGTRTVADDDSLRNVELYRAGSDSVDGWTLVGKIDAYGASSAEFDLPVSVSGISNGEILLTAWFPYDTLNPSGTLPTRYGVGTVDVNTESGAISGSEDSGWRPAISLIP